MATFKFLMSHVVYFLSFINTPLISYCSFTLSLCLTFLDGLVLHLPWVFTSFTVFSSSVFFLKLSSFFNNKNKFNWCWNKTQENLYWKDIKSISQQQIDVYCTCKFCCTPVYKRNNILFPMPSKIYWDKQGMAIPLHGTGIYLRRSPWSKMFWPLLYLLQRNPDIQLKILVSCAYFGSDKFGSHKKRVPYIESGLFPWIENQLWI